MTNDNTTQYPINDMMQLTMFHHLGGSVVATYDPYTQEVNFTGAFVELYEEATKTEIKESFIAIAKIFDPDAKVGIIERDKILERFPEREYGLVIAIKNALKYGKTYKQIAQEQYVGYDRISMVAKAYGLERRKKAVAKE